MRVDELFSLKDAGKVLGVSRNYMWTLVQMNRIPAQKIGRFYVIAKNDIEEYQNRRKKNN